MNILIEKSKFVKLEANFLGFVVPHNAIPKKCLKIKKYPISENI